jgi:hypothetical protein
MQRTLLDSLFGQWRLRLLPARIWRSQLPMFDLAFYFSCIPSFSCYSIFLVLFHLSRAIPSLLCYSISLVLFHLSRAIPSFSCYSISLVLFHLSHALPSFDLNLFSTTDFVRSFIYYYFYRYYPCIHSFFILYVGINIPSSTHAHEDCTHEHEIPLLYIKRFSTFLPFSSFFSSFLLV